jgi:Domain of unknown function (DUF4158)
MALLAKRIRHVRPGIASSITTQLRDFKVNSRSNLGERQYQMSLRLAGPSRAQTLKKQAIARGALVETDVVTSNMGYLRFRKATASDLDQLENWLVDRALEHDRPALLLRLACEHLLGLRIERPGVTHLERVIASARQRAQQETYRRLAPILTRDCKARLDGLLTVDAATGRSSLAWLQQSAASCTPPTILVTLEKRACCRRWGVDRWDVSSLSPNRLKFLAQIARRSTNQALQRMPERRRYPILVAFLYQTLVDLTDEALDLFDRCLADA